jgi:hypothetical protein
MNNPVLFLAAWQPELARSIKFTDDLPGLPHEARWSVTEMLSPCRRNKYGALLAFAV